MSWRDALEDSLSESEDVIGLIEEVKEFLHQKSPLMGMPVDRVRWVQIEKVRANDYNPNAVAPIEMKLLHTSISHDGYTSPIVTIYDKETDQYVIVDGFHRFTVGKLYEDIKKATLGHLPIVVIDKEENDRMASTVRHNRARGKHSVIGMSKIVFDMLENGWEDADICNELGMEPQELLRLKHVTGFSKLFSDREYRKAWETKSMVRLRIAAEKEKKENGREEENDEDAF